MPMFSPCASTQKKVLLGVCVILTCGGIAGVAVGLTVSLGAGIGVGIGVSAGLGLGIYAKNKKNNVPQVASSNDAPQFAVVPSAVSLPLSTQPVTLNAQVDPSAPPARPTLHVTTDSTHSLPGIEVMRNSGSVNIASVTPVAQANHTRNGPLPTPLAHSLATLDMSGFTPTAGDFYATPRISTLR